jgi:hypothetical protein
MYAQYLHDGKKERRAEYIEHTHPHKLKKKEQFNDATHLFSWQCTMSLSDGTRKIKDNRNDVV